MKGMCYIILIVAFLMFYQREPVFSVVIIGIAVAVYLFFRSRRSGTRRGRSGVFSSLLGGNQQQDRNIDDLITLMMVQQLFQESNNSTCSIPPNENQLSKYEQEIEKTKNEILELFDEKV